MDLKPAAHGRGGPRRSRKHEYRNHTSNSSVVNASFLNSSSSQETNIDILAPKTVQDKSMDRIEPIDGKNKHLDEERISNFDSNAKRDVSVRGSVVNYDVKATIRAVRSVNGKEAIGRKNQESKDVRVETGFERPGRNEVMASRSSSSKRPQSSPEDSPEKRTTISTTGLLFYGEANGDDRVLAPDVGESTMHRPKKRYTRPKGSKVINGKLILPATEERFSLESTEGTKLTTCARKSTGSQVTPQSEREAPSSQDPEGSSQTQSSRARLNSVEEESWAPNESGGQDFCARGPQSEQEHLDDLEISHEELGERLDSKEPQTIHENAHEVTFPKFLHLPVEIQAMVWESALSATLPFLEALYDENRKRYITLGPPNSILSVCGSHDLLKGIKPIYLYSLSTTDEGDFQDDLPIPQYIRPEIDTLYIPQLSSLDIPTFLADSANQTLHHLAINTRDAVQIRPSCISIARTLSLELLLGLENLKSITVVSELGYEEFSTVQTLGKLKLEVNLDVLELDIWRTAGNLELTLLREKYFHKFHNVVEFATQAFPEKLTVRIVLVDWPSQISDDEEEQRCCA